MDHELDLNIDILTVNVALGKLKNIKFKWEYIIMLVILVVIIIGVSGGLSCNEGEDC